MSSSSGDASLTGIDFWAMSLVRRKSGLSERALSQASELACESAAAGTYHGSMACVDHTSLVWSRR